LCGTENQVVVLPESDLLILLDDVSTASDDNWKEKIYKSDNQFEFLVTGQDDVDITEYLNRYDLLDIEYKVDEPTIQEDDELLNIVIVDATIEDEMTQYNKQQ